VRTEAKVWGRDRGLAIMALLFPAAFIMFFFTISPALRGELDVIDHSTGYVAPGFEHLYGIGITGIQLMIPAIIASSLPIPALMSLPALFGGFRDKDVLRRLSATPMRSQSLLAAHFVIALAVSLIGAGIAIGAVLIVHSLTMPNNLFTVLLAVVLGFTSMFAIGMLIAARVRRATVGSTIGMLVYFPMIILAGFFAPLEVQTGWIATASELSPLGAASRAMSQGWFQTGFPTMEILVALAWTVVLVPVAIKVFRWK